LTDYLTANDPSIQPPLNDSQQADLYAELASGGETGWDFSARWFAGSTSAFGGLASLNIRNIVGPDLNSILYKNHLLLAELYGSSNTTAATQHTNAAASLKAGILDLCWDSQKLAFYDYIINTNTRSDIFSAAAFYPFWSGIIPDEVMNDEQSAFGAFSSINMVMSRYNGTFPVTFIESGLQWDAPNAWAPHQYIAILALRGLPANITTTGIPSPPSNQSTFALIPAGQLGLNETQLPGQPVRSGPSIINATRTGPDADINLVPNGTVVNGGSAVSGENWSEALQRELANRYFTSVLCSWQATGGSIPNILPRLSDAELNVTQSTTNDGNIFEKFSNMDVDSAGQGGEYTVQVGFGWTNGALLWTASNYGPVLATPQCPDLLATPMATGNQSGSSSGGSSSSSSSSAAAALNQPFSSIEMSVFVVVAGLIMLL